MKRLYNTLPFVDEFKFIKGTLEKIQSNQNKCTFRHTDKINYRSNAFNGHLQCVIDANSKKIVCIQSYLIYHIYFESMGEGVGVEWLGIYLKKGMKAVLYYVCFYMIINNK